MTTGRPMNTGRADIEKLERLPRDERETWQGGFVPLCAWLYRDEGQRYHPIALLWTSLRTDQMEVGGLYTPGAETYEDALELLADFAVDEEVAGYKPGHVEVNDPDLAEWLQGALGEVDIRVSWGDRLEGLEEAATRLAHELTGER